MPSALEAGYPELSNVIEWYGIVVPAATPKDIVTKLNAAMHQALKSPEVAKRVANLGQTISLSTPEQFGALIRAEYDWWGRVAKASGAKAD